MMWKLKLRKKYRLLKCLFGYHLKGNGWCVVCNQRIY